MQEQEIDKISQRSACYLDYRPYVRQICQSEQIRAAESTSSRRYGSMHRCYNRLVLVYLGSGIVLAFAVVLSSGLTSLFSPAVSIDLVLPSLFLTL